MFTDPAQIEDSLERVIGTFFLDEQLDFMVWFAVPDELLDSKDWDAWIKWCQEQNSRTDIIHKPRMHLFYHLLILKSSLGEEWADSFDPNATSEPDDQAF